MFSVRFNLSFFREKVQIFQDFDPRHESEILLPDPDQNYSIMLQLKSWSIEKKEIKSETCISIFK